VTIQASSCMTPLHYQAGSPEMPPICDHRASSTAARKPFFSGVVGLAVEFPL
jgi:hypothetical protein